MTGMQLKLPAGLRLDPNEALMITSGGNAERKILYVNPAFARLTGFEASEWIGRSGDLLLADGPLRMDSLLWLDSDQEGHEVHWIARLHRRDGALFAAEAHVHRIAAKAGGVAQVAVVISDVTDRVGTGKSRGTGATGSLPARKIA